MLKIRDEYGRLVLDDQMLVGRYLTSLEIAWNDKNQHLVTHEGFSKGKPFFQVHNPNSHYLNCYSSVFGNHSYIDIQFSGNTAVCKQIFADGVADNFVDIKRNIIIYFGIY